MSNNVLAYPGAADRGSRIDLLTTRIRSFSTAGTASIANVLDDVTQSDGAEVTFAAANDRVFGQLSNSVVGRPVVVEFSAQQGASSPATAVSVQILYGGSTIHFQRYIQNLAAYSSQWTNGDCRYRKVFPGLRENSGGTLYVQFQSLSSMAQGHVQLGRVQVYHANEPQQHNTPVLAPVNGIVPVSGRYYQGQNPLTALQSAIGLLQLVPVYIAKDCTFSQLFAEFTVAGDSASLFATCVYNDNGSFYPSDLIITGPTISTGTGNAGTVATGGTPGIYAGNIATPVPMKAGLYWIGGVPQGTTAPTMRTGSYGLPSLGLLSLPAANNTSQYAVLQSGVTGALPTTFTTTLSTQAAGARVGFKVQ